MHAKIRKRIMTSTYSYCIYTAQIASWQRIATACTAREVIGIRNRTGSLPGTSRTFLRTSGTGAWKISGEESLPILRRFHLTGRKPLSYERCAKPEIHPQG